MKVLKYRYGLRLKFISIFSFALLVLPLQIWANQNSPNEILRNMIIAIENHFPEDNQIGSIHPLNGLDAWVDDSEFTWSNSDIGDFDDQKLSFEVKFKNNEQIRVEQQILNMGQSKVAFKKTSLLEKRLKTTYLSLINYIDQRRRKTILEQQRVLASSELNSLKINVNSDNFRPDKLQQVDLTLDNIWADELENNATLKRYKKQWYKQKNEITFPYLGYNSDSIISLAQMIEITESIINNRFYEKHNSLIKKAELDTVLLSKQMQRDYAQKKLSLNSVKLEYDKKDNSLGFSIGVKIPITQNSYDSLLKEQQQHFANIDMQHSVIEVSEKLRDKQFQLLRVQDQWLSNQKLLHRINARIIRISSTNNVNLLLELKYQRLQKRMRQEEFLIRALKEYIAFLNIAGMLSAKPYRNWIQAGTPQIL